MAQAARIAHGKERAKARSFRISSGLLDQKLKSHQGRRGSLRSDGPGQTGLSGRKRHRRDRQLRPCRRAGFRPVWCCGRSGPDRLKRKGTRIAIKGKGRSITFDTDQRPQAAFGGQSPAAARFKRIEIDKQVRQALNAPRKQSKCRAAAYALFRRAKPAVAKVNKNGFGIGVLPGLTDNGASHAAGLH